MTAGKPSLLEIIALFFADGFLEPFEDLQHVLPDFPYFRRALIAKQIGGMICDHQRHTAVGMPAPAQFAHRPAGAEQTFDGNRAERDYDFGLNDVDLFD